MWPVGAVRSEQKQASLDLESVEQQEQTWIPLPAREHLLTDARRRRSRGWIDLLTPPTKSRGATTMPQTARHPHHLRGPRSVKSMFLFLSQPRQFDLGTLFKK